MHMSWSTFNQQLTSCRSSVKRMSTEYQLGYQWSMDQDVDHGYRSRALIDTRHSMAGGFRTHEPLILQPLSVSHLPLKKP